MSLLSYKVVVRLEFMCANGGRVTLSLMAILVEPKLARELRVARELRLALELRLTREVRVTVRLSREPTAVTVSLRPRPCSAFLGVDSSSRRTTSTAFSSSIILGCLEF